MKNWLLVILLLIVAFVGWITNDWYHSKFDKKPTQDTVISLVTLPADTQRVNLLIQARFQLQRKLTLTFDSLKDKNKKFDLLMAMFLEAQKDTLEPVATLDTVIGPYRDTLNLKYYIFGNYFDYSFIPGYRKTQIKEITKYVDKLVEVNPKLWFQFAQQFNAEKFGGRFSLGYKYFGIGYGILYKEKPLIELIYHQNF